MTISLPYLWIWGHLAAVLGGALAVLHLFRRSRAAIALGLLGGCVSAAWLAVILAAIGQSFFGLYRWLAWAVAFFAGYACGALVGHGWSLARGIRRSVPLAR